MAVCCQIKAAAALTGDSKHAAASTYSATENTRDLHLLLVMGNWTSQHVENYELIKGFNEFNIN